MELLAQTRNTRFQVYDVTLSMSYIQKKHAKLDIIFQQINIFIKLYDTELLYQYKIWNSGLISFQFRSLRSSVIYFTIVHVQIYKFN